MSAWQIQEVKARLSEVLDLAKTEGPQTITRHGKAQAVIVSITEYEELASHKPSFKAHLLGGPKVSSCSK